MAELRTIELPPHLEAIPEFAEVDRVSDIQMLKLAQEIEDLEDDIHIQTATEAGIARREKILGITPLDTQSLQLRRDNVNLMWYDVYPYTALDLQRRLDLLCGEGNSTILQSITADDQQEMEVQILLVTKERKAAIEEMLERIVPLHIAFHVEILYHCWDEYRNKKKWNDFAPKTWEFIKEGIEEGS